MFWNRKDSPAVSCSGQRFWPGRLLVMSLVLAPPVLGINCKDFLNKMSPYQRILSGMARQDPGRFDALRPAPGFSYYMKGASNLDVALYKGEGIKEATQQYLGELNEKIRVMTKAKQDSKEIKAEAERIRTLQATLFPETRGFTSRLADMIGLGRDAAESRAVDELHQIEERLSEIDPQTHEFRELARRQVKLLKEHFSYVTDVSEYIKDLESLYHLDEKSRSVFFPVTPKGEREEELLRTQGEKAAIHRLPGNLKDKIAAARKSLADLPVFQFRNENGKILLPENNPKLFLTAEKFALARRAQPTLKFTEAEKELANAYENTISELRSREVEIRSENPAELNRLNYLIAATSDALGTTREGRHFLGTGQNSFDYEFVQDRFRYLLSDGKMTLAEALELTRDVRLGQAQAHYTDLWWFYEARSTQNAILRSDYGSPVLLKRGDVANSAWENFQKKLGTNDRVTGHYLTDENVLSGPITDQVINGKGLARDKNYILQRGKGTRISRPYDPAQREALGQNGEIPKRTVGWQQVGEVELGKSGNPALKGVIRRMFWNELPVDGRDRRSPIQPGGENAIGGTFRIAQQSIPLSKQLEKLPTNLRAEVEQHLKRRPAQPMSPSLAARLQKVLNEVGEVDAVRGEIIIGIEAIIDGRAVPRGFQWTWDPKRGEWVPNETVRFKEEDEKTREEPVLMNCQRCHASKALPKSMDGRCIKGPKYDVPFVDAARKALERARARDDK